MYSVLLNQDILRVLKVASKIVIIYTMSVKKVNKNAIKQFSVNIALT